MCYNLDIQNQKLFLLIAIIKYLIDFWINILKHGIILFEYDIRIYCKTRISAYNIDFDSIHSYGLATSAYFFC